jgi:hypothetical protein
MWFWHVKEILSLFLACQDLNSGRFKRFLGLVLIDVRFQTIHDQISAPWRLFLHRIVTECSSASRVLSERWTLWLPSADCIWNAGVSDQNIESKLHGTASASCTRSQTRLRSCALSTGRRRRCLRTRFRNVEFSGFQNTGQRTSRNLVNLRVHEIVSVMWNPKFHEHAGFEVFTAVTTKNAVFWDVAPCRML